MSQRLQEVRSFEEDAEKRIPECARPMFHLTARAGWMNDPNGFSYYQGKYHLFYQYHPYKTIWGPMYWGHAVSDDLVRWKFLPAALAPDQEYDQDGCFSGTAIELPDGTHALLYTGVRNENQDDGTIEGVQTQCVALGNGVDYVKYEKNPVLDERDLPEGASRFDFRDPKIWRKGDGSYRLLVGSRSVRDFDGKLQLYSSPNGLDWTFLKTLIENRDRFGRMWECPDIFPLDGKTILIVSPQDMLATDNEYHSGNGTVAIIGSYDDETDTFIEESNQTLDSGIDFYAPQTVETPDGRRVMIGWFQNWDTLKPPTHERAWNGQMSTPRELHLRNGRIVQSPVRELETYRRNPVRYSDVLFSGSLKLDGIRGRCLDLEIELEADDPNDLYQKFTINFAENESFHSSVSYKPGKGSLKIDRRYSGTRRAFLTDRAAKIQSVNGRIKLRLILDRFSVEVFANDGENVLSMTLYTVQSADGISFHCDKPVRMNITQYDLCVSS